MLENMTFTKNEQFNSLEISFDEKPSQEVRDILKANHFKWHSVKKVWYGYKTQEEIEKALNGSDTTEAKLEQNNHSLKVGDILSSSWGYEQGNNDFYKVVKTSKTCVWLIRVSLPIKESKACSGMSEDRRYDIENPRPYYDDETPFRKTVHNYSVNKEPEYDNVSISDYERAHKYNGEWMYCSWYA